MTLSCIARMLLAAALLLSTLPALPQSSDEEGVYSAMSWSAIKLAIGEISVRNSGKFHRSMCIFVSRRCLRYAEDYLFVRGDLNESVYSTPVVHITGSLREEVSLSQHSELIIGGDVDANSTIYVNGISQVFIAGDFNGTIESNSWLMLFVDGNFNGQILTTHSIDIEVKRNFNGTIKLTTDTLATIDLHVSGFADADVLDSLYEQDFLSVNSFIARSNLAKGVAVRNRKHYLVVGETVVSNLDID